MFDLENLFGNANSDVMNICTKFHWNPSTKYRDTMSHGIGVNGWTDGRTANPKPLCLSRLLLAAEGQKQ